MAAVVELSYFVLGWENAQVPTLCEALRAAHAGGGLRKLEHVAPALNYNEHGGGISGHYRTHMTGHYWYDVHPHTDRWGRKWTADRPWTPSPGP
eukprot:scaffold24648_cov67-Phaeocystis_antarctica.AAC.2